MQLVAERRAQNHQVRVSRVVRGDPSGAERLAPRSTFTMAMRQAGAGYRSTNRVVEYEPDRLLAWESGGCWHGRNIVGGQWWRFALQPHPGGAWSSTPTCGGMRVCPC